MLDVEAFSLRRPGPINPKNSYASPTPVADADRIYVHFGALGTAALSLTGEILWKTRFPYESQHGAGGSPILFGDLLILSCDGSDDAFVVAVDKKTGKVRWRTPRRLPVDQAYSTPLVVRVAERDVVVSVGAYRAGAYDAQTGREMWRVSYADGFSNVPRPVFGHGLVFIATGFQEPSLIAVRPDGSGDVTRTHIAWTLKRGAPLTPSPLLVGDELYLVNDGGIATAVDAKTGTVIWQQRLLGTFSASPIFADGRIYFLSEQGVATIVAPGREFRVLGTPRLDGATLASMAVADRSLFIRTDTHLYRIASPQGQELRYRTRRPRRRTFERTSPQDFKRRSGRTSRAVHSRTSSAFHSALQALFTSDLKCTSHVRPFITVVDEGALHVARPIDRAIELLEVGLRLLAVRLAEARLRVVHRHDFRLQLTKAGKDGLELGRGPARSAIQPIAHGREAEMLAGDGVRRVHEAGIVEVVRDREALPRLRLDEANVVLQVHRHVGVADHVLEDGHLHDRLQVDTIERHLLQIDTPAFEPLRDVVIVFDQHAVPRGDRLLAGLHPRTSSARAAP